MVALTLGTLGTFDLLIAIITVVTVYGILIFAESINERGYASWISRKLIHISVSSIVGITLVLYENLAGPLAAIVLFLIPLFIARLFFGKPVRELLKLASREQDRKNRWYTLAAGILAIISYGLVFLVFPQEPAIFVSAILAVSWGDGSGELIGRPFGTRKYQVFGNERTLLGSIAVFLFTIIATAFSFQMFSSRALLELIPMFLVVGFVVMLMEAISISWLDNFLIPLSAAGILYLLLF
jgi:dolichol kinase